MRSLKILAVVLLCGLLSGCLVSRETYDQKVAESQRLSAERERLRSGLAETTESNEKLNQELIDFKEEMDQQQRRWQDELASLQLALEDKDNQLDQLYRKSDSLQADRMQLQSELENEKVARAARIASLKSTYDELVGTLEDEIERERQARKAAAARIRATYDELSRSLSQEIDRGEISLDEQEGRLKVNMAAKVLFNSGRAEVNPQGLGILKKVGNALKKVRDKSVHVEGHTDSVPISGRLKERFFSNWELSTARSTAVVRYLESTSGIPGERLVATGFAAYRPVAGNKTPQGRASNRRIEIVLLPLAQASAQ